MRNALSRCAPKIVGRRKAARLARCIQPVLEPLENRRLLSTSITLSDGVLTLDGDPVLPTSLQVSLASSGQDLAVSAGQGHIATEPLSAVKQINIIGGAGNDYIYVQSNITIPAVVNSGDGKDSIQTGAGSDTINAGDGNDWISAGDGNNVVHAGAGNNTITAGDGNDYLQAGNGDNNIQGTSGNDTIIAGSGNNTLTGGGGDDSIVGGNGSDYLDGGIADDSLISGTGQDTLAPGTGNNYIVEGNTADSIIPSSGTNTLVGLNGQQLNAAPPPVNASIAWTPYSAPSPTSTNAPRAIMEMLAPVTTVGVAIDVRAVASTLGAGSPITANYQWNFDDSAGENNQLQGYNASHIYNIPGTYTIQLTVTNEIGKTSTVSAQVTISASTRRQIYVDGVNGSDSNNGSSPTLAVRTPQRAAALITDNSQVLFARGQTFNITSTFMTPFINVVVGAYGTGANPIMMGTRTVGVMFSTQDASTGITLQDLTFDTTGAAADPGDLTGLPMAIVPRGNDINILRCTFLHVDYAINADTSVVGLTVQDSSAPVANGLQGYFIWDQGNDTTVLGNTANGSLQQHVVRTSGANQLLIANNNFTNNDGKGCIEIHVGSYAWIQGNTANNGDIRVGPLGLFGEPVTDTTQYAVIQGNTVNNAPINVYPGSLDISIRNNIINRKTAMMIDIIGHDSTGMISSDIRILNNTGVSDNTNGNFLKVENHATGIVLENNLLIMPNMSTGSYNTAPVFVSDTDLSSFTAINGNVWQQPKTIAQFANGGINFVGTAYVSAGYLTAAEWNAEPVVGTDYFTSTSTGSNLAPSSGSIAATAGSAASGVFADFYGNARPLSGAVTAGAVQIGGASPQGSTAPPPSGSITGTIYQDSNANGKQDSTEAGLAGVTVYLDVANTGSLTSTDPTTTTNSSGAYSFSGLTAGAYIVRQILPTGDSQITPSSNFGQHVSVSAGQTVSGANFGDRPVSANPLSSISGSSSSSLEFTSTDIGSVGKSGSMSAVNGTYTITGAGANIGDSADALQYDYTALDGDGTIIAQVDSLADANAWAKAGVMIRDGNTAGAKEVSMLISPNGESEFQRRWATNQTTGSTDVANASAPEWVKLVRQGNAFTGYISKDGKTWTEVDSTSVTMNTEIEIGLAVTSRVAGTSETATFSNVSIT